MSLKIPTTGTWYNLSLLFGEKRLTLKANGANIRYLLMQEYPSDVADYALRTDVNTETAAGLTGSVYDVADETLYRKGEIVTIYTNAGVAKGRARITAKATGKITVEKIENAGAFTLLANDKIFIGSDEILVDGADEILFDVYPSNIYLFALSSSEAADNLQITSVDSKKKI